MAYGQMVGCREHYDVLLVDVRCNLVRETSLRSITKHHWTPCNPLSAASLKPILKRQSFP